MKWIVYLNLAGVLALAALCVIQWERNSDLNRQVINLEKTRQEQVQEIAGQKTSIKNVTADLDDFRSRLQLAEDQLKKDDDTIVKLKQERNGLILERNRALAERDEAKATTAKWEAAVKQRDDVIKTANDELVKLGKERNEGAVKYNDLAGKYNDLVKDLDEARAKLVAKK